MEIDKTGVANYSFEGVEYKERDDVGKKANPKTAGQLSKMRIKAIKSVLSIINGNARNDNRNAVKRKDTPIW